MFEVGDLVLYQTFKSRRDESWEGPAIILRLESRSWDWDVEKPYAYNIYWVMLPTGQEESFLERELKKL